MYRFAASPIFVWLGLGAFNAHAAPPAPFAPPAPARAMPAAMQAELESPVTRLLTNPYGEVDGLRLSDGTIVRFPPHLAEALTAAVQVGDRVRVIGRRESASSVKADAIVNTATGQTVYDQPPAPRGGRPMPAHLRMAGLQTQQAQGHIDVVLTGPRGEAQGVILSDGSIVRFPPHALQQALRQGQPFAASGLGTRNAYGASLEAVSTGASLSDLQPLYDRP
ncbi:Uncharacterised protein [Delftia tsuruhatensis]|uniref:hypothetical protein n=1 Tax=Delftia tsuruhatensis TaxID=180282 RepID=UPI001E7D72F7|nr:hypothetical protein [Delftia tsuruhatensis]CAB5693567.1 Uncharacterised protein [Delftia tsuruhatensis]CAC9687423.1 Uncharacterised protein [Delftia tsuruhatensis]